MEVENGQSSSGVLAPWFSREKELERPSYRERSLLFKGFAISDQWDHDKWQASGPFTWRRPTFYLDFFANEPAVGELSRFSQWLARPWRRVACIGRLPAFHPRFECWSPAVSPGRWSLVALGGVEEWTRPPPARVPVRDRHTCMAAGWAPCCGLLDG